MTNNRYSLEKRKNHRSMIIDARKVFLLTGALAGAIFFGSKGITQIATNLPAFNEATKEVQLQEQGAQRQADIVDQALNTQNSEITESKDDEITNTQNSEITEPEDDEYVSPYNFDQLHEVNEDIVAVIEGDIFNEGHYPVVSTENIDEENYYLNHTPEGEYNTGGSIIADFRNGGNYENNIEKNDDYGYVSIIWGHNFYHDSTGENSGEMFASITDYKSQEYYNAHPTLKYYTPYGEYNLEIFAYVEEDARNQLVGSYPAEDFVQKMYEIKDNSYISSDVVVNPGDHVYILNTCTDISNQNINEGDIYVRGSLYTVARPVNEKTYHSKSL